MDDVQTGHQLLARLYVLMLEQVIYESFVCAFVAYTISTQKIFKQFREKINGLSSFLGNLVRCFYCTGVWVAFLLEIIFQSDVFLRFDFLGYLLTSFLIAWFSAFQCLVVDVLFKISGR